MTNAEKYREEIMNYNGGRFCNDFIKNRIIKDNDCEEIDCNKCILLQFLWLMEEYEEPEEPEIDWSTVAVDTPILVRDEENEPWYKRHFAEYKDGLIWTYAQGTTSWSTVGELMMWRTGKLAERGEQK